MTSYKLSDKTVIYNDFNGDKPTINNKVMIAFYKNKQLHRDQGPALVYREIGTFVWYNQGKETGKLVFDDYAKFSRKERKLYRKFIYLF